MPKKQKAPEQTSIEKMIEEANTSKHPEAIIHLYASKDQLKWKIKWLIDHAKSIEWIPLSFSQLLEKAIALVAEEVFNWCVQILVDDKDENVKKDQ